MSSSRPKTVLFYRDFSGPAVRGGDLKLWDYFNHVRSGPAFRAMVAFAPKSRFESENPWAELKGAAVPFDPSQADAIFLAGTDWRMLTSAQRENPPVPVINLLQGFRHVTAGDPTNEYLRHP